MQIIPFKQPGSWQSQITLTGVIYILRFKWNALNQYWVMSIYDASDNPIMYSIKVVVNWNLTSQFVVLEMPAGTILCQNILAVTEINEPDGIIKFQIPPSSFQPIGRFDMGQTVELFYYEPGELASIAS